MDVRFFPTSAAFRRWLATNHDKATEVWVGFYRKESGRRAMTYPEAVDQALCFGWIDGVRRKLDEISYVNRFSPRTSRSVWSNVNVRRVEELKAQGLMADPGLAAFAARSASRSGIYSFEQRPASLGAYERQFKTNENAWAYFASETPSYRRMASWWVLSAAKEETRLRRLATLIADSAQGRRIRGASPRSRRAAGTGGTR